MTVADEPSPAPLLSVRRFPGESHPGWEYGWIHHKGRPAAWIATNQHPGLLDVLEAAFAAQAKIADYERAICWDTTCTSCAKWLDALAHRDLEGDEAKDTLAEVRQFLAELGTAAGSLDTQGIVRRLRRIVHGGTLEEIREELRHG